jgi:creatinine amidohydrolase/Fe(II)-dependent formamide hydrolase-like protein
MAAALSEKLHILLAPALAFGCSTPYNAFGGTAGVTPRTLTNILCETIRQWYRQGFRTMVIIDGLYDNSEAVDLAARRLKCAHPAMKIILFSLQRDERIRAFIGQYFHEKESGRAAYGMLSLAAYIDPAMIREGAAVGPQQALPDTERYRTWRKRGADPDQYRKLFPHACSGSTMHGFDPEFGRELFGFILQVLVDTVTPLLKSCHQ